MRIYLAAAAAVVLIAVACGSNEDGIPTAPVTTTGAPPAASLSSPTAEPFPSTEPTAATGRSPTVPTTLVSSPTPSRLTPTAEPTEVSPLTSAPILEATGDQSALRYLALGDSYTIGEGVEPALRWPVQLAERLRSAGVSVAVPEIVVRTGWTTTDLAAGIDGAEPQGIFDIVTLLIGVNDQFRGRSVESFRQGFNGLLQRAIVFAGDSPSNVVVVSIPDWGVTPFASGLDKGRIAAEIDLFNQTTREETVQAGALFVDITGISREAESDLDLLAADRLHLSGLMYEKWVDVVLPAAVEILN